MRGRDLRVNPDDLMETPESEQEAKQEILENKEVSCGSSQGTSDKKLHVIVCWCNTSQMPRFFTAVTALL